jgi:hypothetical protein
MSGGVDTYRGHLKQLGFVGTGTTGNLKAEEAAGLADDEITR